MGVPHKEWIAYCGAIPFPTGWSASRRAYGVARTLTSAGYNVVFINSGALKDEPLEVLCNEDDGTLSCVGLDERPPPKASILIKAVCSLFLAGKRIVDYLESQSTKPTHVIMYQGYLPHMLRLASWCRRNDVPLISDVVDWYNASHLPGGFWGMHNINAKLALRFAYTKCNGVIAISSYLENYYNSYGVKTIRIPTTLNLDSVEKVFSLDNNGDDYPISLIYAGSTQQGKDLIENIIQGLILVDPKGEHFKLTLLGPSREEIHALVKTEIPPFIDFIGIVPQTEVAKFVGQMDFSVLLRKPLLYAQAGFPTKFAESLACCTPVVANITSDIGMYLTDGIEGIVCSDFSPDAFADSLRRILELSTSERKAMRYSARALAEKHFDFRRYTEPMRSFIETLRM